MTEPDDAFREALRDLIPDYTGPVDPMVRVAATVRRRRTRQRTLLTACVAGVAVVLALTVPAVVLGHGGAGNRAAAPYVPAPPLRLASYPVENGTIGSRSWAVATTSLSPGAHRCLYSDDDVSDNETVCFETWSAGDPVTWVGQAYSDKGLEVTRVVGVAPAGTGEVRVRLTSGPPLVLRTRSTPTDGNAVFFGRVVRGTVTVRDVTPLDGKGTATGPPVARPAVDPCLPPPGGVCATPSN